MEALYRYSSRLINDVNTDFHRYLYDKVDWNNRLIAITGSRGVGKTTLLKQWAKENHDYVHGKVLYVSLDHIWFATHSLFDFADAFVRNDGKILILDEVHKYKTWSREIKNIYDYIPDLQVVFTGSSLLKMTKGEGDLSRRVATYHLQGMSFREFMQFEHGMELPVLSLDEILSHHVEIALDLTHDFHPQRYFVDYLKFGYYPFYKEDCTMYYHRLLSTINTVLEVDLLAVENVEMITVERLRKLLGVIAECVPFIPNITELGHLVGTSRLNVLKYLKFLHDARLTMLLPKNATGLKQMEKPEKIYLGNTNYAYAFGEEKADIGNVRETFFFNQLSHNHEVCATPYTDFLIDGQFSFELGVKNKKKKRIEGLENAFVVKDNIELGTGNVIPLWLFGLMY